MTAEMKKGTQTGPFNFYYSGDISIMRNFLGILSPALTFTETIFP